MCRSTGDKVCRALSNECWRDKVEVEHFVCRRLPRWSGCCLSQVTKVK